MENNAAENHCAFTDCNTRIVSFLNLIGSSLSIETLESASQHKRGLMSSLTWRVSEANEIRVPAIMTAGPPG